MKGGQMEVDREMVLYNIRKKVLLDVMTPGEKVSHLTSETAKLKRKVKYHRFIVYDFECHVNNAAIIHQPNYVDVDVLELGDNDANHDYNKVLVKSVSVSGYDTLD
eukprot:16441013-Heterocapsa_arctica.AAC.1